MLAKFEVQFPRELGSCFDSTLRFRAFLKGQQLRTRIPRNCESIGGRIRTAAARDCGGANHEKTYGL
jgi:hypothetical protein